MTRPLPGRQRSGQAAARLGLVFNDHDDGGMRRQMVTLGNIGLLARFVGMLTDSRCLPAPRILPPHPVRWSAG